MAIFTRLFTTRIVASNESLFLSNFSTRSDAIVLRCLSWRISAGCNEKKAASDADIIPDAINSKTVATIKMIASVITSGAHSLSVIKPSNAIF